SLRREVLQQRDLFVGEWENLFPMDDNRAEQRFVLTECHHYPGADPARVNKLPIGRVGAVDLFLSGVGQVDGVLTARHPTERSVGEQRGGAFLSHRFDKLRIPAQCHRVSTLALDAPDVSVSGIAQVQCLFQYRIKYRPEVAGRGIDDLQYLRGTRLL